MKNKFIPTVLVSVLAFGLSGKALKFLIKGAHGVDDVGRHAADDVGRFADDLAKYGDDVARYGDDVARLSGDAGRHFSTEREYRAISRMLTSSNSTPRTLRITDLYNDIMIRSITSNPRYRPCLECMLATLKIQEYHKPGSALFAAAISLTYLNKNEEIINQQFSSNDYKRLIIGELTVDEIEQLLSIDALKDILKKPFLLSLIDILNSCPSDAKENTRETDQKFPTSACG